MGMSAEPPPTPAPPGRTVKPDTLVVAPAILGLPLAEPWRRLVAMVIDLGVVGLLSFLAGPWLGERLSAGRWLAVLAGFGGVLLIARPGGAVTVDGIALALLAAACYAAYQILTRQLAATEGTVTLVFYTALVGTVAMSLALPFFWRDIAQVAPGDAWLIAALGVLGGSGHFLLTRAFRHAPASTLSPFIYVQLVWATVLGAAVFGQWPDWVSAFGMAAIVTCGLWLAVDARRASRLLT